jgi:hypothetical protein
MAVLCGSNAAAAERDPVYVLNPKLSEDRLAPWLFYLGARAEYRKQHKLPAPATGEIAPTFREEVTARQAAVAMYSVLKSSSGRDPYWEALAKVDSAGFIKEYVWTYLHRREWPTSD